MTIVYTVVCDINFCTCSNVRECARTGNSEMHGVCRISKRITVRSGAVVLLVEPRLCLVEGALVRIMDTQLRYYCREVVL